MEPKIGMKFYSYKEVLRNAQKNKEVQGMQVYTLDNGRIRTNINLKNGVLNMEEPGNYSKNRRTDVAYSTDTFLYKGNGLNGQYTQFTEIYGSKTYAKDLNGNGIVDANEIFKQK